MDLLCFCSVLCLLCFCARLFICALWSPAGKGLTSWLSFVVSNCEFVTFPLVSWVRCGTWLYRFLIFAPLLTFINRLCCFQLLQVLFPKNQGFLFRLFISFTSVRKYRLLAPEFRDLCLILQKVHSTNRYTHKRISDSSKTST